MMQKHLELLKIQKKDSKFHQLNITEDLIEEYRLINNKMKFCWKVGYFYYNLLKKCC